MTRRLVVASNWVPSPADLLGTPCADSDTESRPNGSGNVLWFGWSGRTADSSDPAVAIWSDASTTLATVDLSPRQRAGYLDGFAETTLWPILHDVTEGRGFQAEQLAIYRSVNRLFAARLAPMLRNGDRVLVHDYHLIPLGSILRRAGVEAPIGFFLHAPFPAAEILLAQPWHLELAAGLAAYDLVGFQSQRDEMNFVEFMLRVRSGHQPGAGFDEIRHMPTTGTFPLGGDLQAPSGSERATELEDDASRLAHNLRGQNAVAVTVRLDWKRNALAALSGFERLLEESPEHRNRSCFVQVTTPPYSAGPGHLDLQMLQEGLVHRINARFRSRDWTPVLDIRGTLPPRSLAALYRSSRVNLSIVHGDEADMAMREFVAAQDPRDPGVLLLPRHAVGAELAAEALSVDPADSEKLARALRTALQMPLAERQHRWARMVAKLRFHDTQRCAHSFLGALSGAHQAFTFTQQFERPSSRPARGMTIPFPLDPASVSAIGRGRLKSRSSRTPNVRAARS